MAGQFFEMLTTALRGGEGGECNGLPRYQRILLALLFVALLLAASNQQGEAKVVAHAEGVTVVITRTGAAAAAGATMEVTLNIEVTEQATAELYGYHSMNSVVDIDCGGGRDRVRKAQAFEMPHFAGPSQARRTSGEWVRPTPGAFMADVIEKACSSAGLGSRPPALVPAVPPASSNPPLVPSKLAVAPIASPGALPPQSTGESGEVGRIRAQIASSSTERGALAILEEVKSEIPPTLAAAVETAEVGGKKVYRSVIEGLASEADAESFCDRMRQAKVGCIVRKRGGGAGH